MSRRVRVLAICSGGGHWIRMMRLLPALEGTDAAFATVDAGYRADVGDARFHVIPDASAWTKARLIALAARVFLVVLRERPDVVLSTGAAPGFFGLMFGKWLGARTVWLDSIANGEELSLAGRKVRRFADLWLTQWPELARETGPEYAGSVL